MTEKRCIKSKQHQDLLDYKHINSIYKKHLHHSKKTHILSKLNDNKNKTRNLYKILKSLTKLKDENPMPPTESPSDLPNKFADFFLKNRKKSETNFMTKIHIHHTIGNAQDSLASCLWKGIKYSASSKYEPKNLYHGSLQYQISTRVQGNNLRCHHHHC